MFTQEGFNNLIDRLIELGVQEEKACDYAAIIGDTPVSDGNGNVLIIKDGKIIDSVPDPFA